MAITGIFAGGTLNVIPRSPEVTINGPTVSSPSRRARQTVSKSYSVTERIEVRVRSLAGG